MDILLEKLAGKISSETGRSSGTMLFGLRVLWNFLSGYTVLAVFSLLLGMFSYTMIAALSTSTLRVMSGGAHASSSNRCLVYGTTVFLSLGYLAQQPEIMDSEVLLNAFTVFIWVTGVPIIFKYARSSINGKPLGTYASGRKFRNLAIGCLTLWAAVVLFMPTGEYGRIFRSASLWGVTYQMFSLTPWGHKTVAAVDKLLCKIHI